MSSSVVLRMSFSWCQSVGRTCQWVCFDSQQMAGLTLGVASAGEMRTIQDRGSDYMKTRRSVAFLALCLAAACGNSVHSTPTATGGRDSGSGGQQSMATAGNAALAGNNNEHGAGSGAAGALQRAGADGVGGPGGSNETGGMGGVEQAANAGSGGRTGGIAGGGRIGGGGAGGTGGGGAGGRAGAGGQAGSGVAEIGDNTPSHPAVPLDATAVPMLGKSIAGLEVRQSYFFVDPNARPKGTWTWLAVVKNTQTEPACTLRVEAEFVLSGGQILNFFGAVFAHVYRVPGSNAALRCIGPGDVGVGVSAPTAGVPVALLSDVSAIRYAITGIMTGGAIAANWVTISNLNVQSAPGGARVTGTLNNTVTLPSWGVDVFPKNAAGMPLAYFFLSDPRSQLAPGASWAFETPVFSATFSDAYVFEKHDSPSGP